MYNVSKRQFANIDTLSGNAVSGSLNNLLFKRAEKNLTSQLHAVGSNFQD